MIINLNPVSPIPGTYLKPEVLVKGDVITINGEAFDFAPLPEGATLPNEAIGSSKFVGDVARENGEIVVSIMFQHTEDASEEARFPEPIVVTKDGQVELPE